MFEIEDNNTIISIPLDKENTVISRDYYYGDKVGEFISEKYPESYSGGDLAEFEVITVTTGQITFVLKWMYDSNNANIYSEISDALTTGTPKRIRMSGKELHSFRAKLNISVIVEQ